MSYARDAPTSVSMLAGPDLHVSYDPVTVPVDAVLQLEPEHLDRSRKQAVEGLDPEKCVRDQAIWALRCGTRCVSLG